MSISSESYLLHFWSPFPGCKEEESYQSPGTTQKTDEAFKLTSSQIQHENSNSGGFIEDPKILEKLGFFKALAFLDDLKDGELIKRNPVIECTKQNDAMVNDKQITANSCENEQNNDSSTKKTSQVRRSKRIAERNL